MAAILAVVTAIVLVIIISLAFPGYQPQQPMIYVYTPPQTQTYSLPQYNYQQPTNFGTCPHGRFNGGDGWCYP